MAANDTVQKLAIYGSGAFPVGTQTITNYTRWLETASTRNYIISKCVAKGFNLIYLGNQNAAGGSTGTTYSGTSAAGDTWISLITLFIQECNAQGIEVGQVIPISNTGPANKVKNFNALDSSVQIKYIMAEDEYWFASGRPYAQWKTNFQAVRAILNPVNVSCDAYLANWAAGELAGLIGIVDIFWLTQFSKTFEYKRSSFAQSISGAVNELSAANPASPVKVGVLCSAESHTFNATGSLSVNGEGNFQGSKMAGNRIAAVNPPVRTTARMCIQQMADMYTHNGLPTTPTPREFNSEPLSVQADIDWQGVQIFSWKYFDAITTLDKRTDNVMYAIGDGADNTNINTSKNIASRVPLNSGAFLYLGDIYSTGTAAEYRTNYDTVYGTQAPNFHNLLISTSSTLGNHEWPNRTTGSDLYWNGTLGGAGINSDWDGDRTYTNPRWYSFTRNGWKIIVIGTMEDGHSGGGMTTGSLGHQWLIAQLATSGVKKIVVGHHPRWSCAPGHPDNANMQPVWAAMQGKAHLYICGHSHTFQIHKMTNASGNVVSSGGCYTVVNGVGGTPNSGTGGAYLDANGIEKISYKTNTYGGAKITLNDDSVDVCHFDQNGNLSGCTNLPINSPNIAPIVNAGIDQSITLPSTAVMGATASDDSLPAPAGLTYYWTMVSGTGTATFSSASLLNPTVSFSSAGTYVLQLSVSDGQSVSTDTVQITVAAGAATKTLTINSTTPLTGVSVVVSIADLNGLQNGSTSFQRTYLATTSVVLTAPSTIGGNLFVKWLRDGVVFSTLVGITASDIYSHTFTAVYEVPTGNYYTVYVTSSNPGFNIPITTTGMTDGVTPFSNYVLSGTSVVLTAPTVSGRTFQKWVKDGTTLVSTSASITVSITDSVTYSAVYVPLSGEITLIAYQDKTSPNFYFNRYFFVNLWTNGTANFSGTVMCEGVSHPFTYTNALLSELGWDFEWDKIYTITILDSTGKTSTTKINAIRAAMPSARMEVVQPTACLSTGSAAIAFAGNVAPYGTPPMGWGAVMPCSYTKQAADSAGAGATTQVRTGLAGPTISVRVVDASPIYPQYVVNSATITTPPNILTNKVIGGDLSVNPTGVSPAWVLTGCTYDSTNKAISYTANAQVADITLALTSGKYYFGGFWMESSGVGALATTSSGGITSMSGGTTPSAYLNFTTIGFLATSSSGHLLITSNTGFVGKIYKFVIYEYDINFNATLAAPATMSEVSRSIVNCSCNGGGNGSVTVNITGGDGGYHYSWSKAGSSDIFNDSNVINNLYAGVYTVVVNDGCSTFTPATFTVTEPAAIVVTPTITNVTAAQGANGTITLGATGGSGGYVYYVNGILLGGNIANGLSAGDHNYQVVDSSGCSVVAQFSISQPATPLKFRFTNFTQPVCVGQNTATASGVTSGGVPPYNYRIDTVYHGNPDDGIGSFSNTTGSFTGLAPNIDYYATVRDANGEYYTDTVRVPDAYALTVDETHINTSSSGSHDGSIRIVVNGSTNAAYPMTLVWNTGYTQSLLQNDPGTYNGLGAGTYTGVLTSLFGCVTNISVTITSPPPVIIVHRDPFGDFFIRANCCLGDKLYEMFHAYKNGHNNLDCLYIPLMTLSNHLKILKKWYPLGQTFGGTKGHFVFYPVFSQALSGTYILNIKFLGNNIITPFNWVNGNSIQVNLTAVAALLTTAGWQSEYNSGNLWIYSPKSEFYNGLPIDVSFTGTGAGQSIVILTSNGIQGAINECITDDNLISQCLSEDQVLNMIEQIKDFCGECLCSETSDLENNVHLVRWTGARSSPTITERVVETIVGVSGSNSVPVITTILNQSSYTVPSGMTIKNVFLDNLRLRTDQYSYSGTTLTLIDPPIGGQELLIEYA